MPAPRLGGVVRVRRERLRLTQQELADKIGVSRSAISELEAGRITQPRAAVFARLAKVLGIPAAALLIAAGYPEADFLQNIEGDDLAVLGASLATLAGDQRDWLRGRLTEVRDLLMLRQAERARTRTGAARKRRS